MREVWVGMRRVGGEEGGWQADGCSGGVVGWCGVQVVRVVGKAKAPSLLNVTERVVLLPLGDLRVHRLVRLLARLDRGRKLELVRLDQLLRPAARAEEYPPLCRGVA